MPQIVELIAQFKPDVVVAGPAFAAGRYGLNCGRVCADAQTALGVPTVSGMHEENPGVDSYQTQVHIVATRDSAVGMNDAIQRMAGIAVKLGRNDEPVGSPSDEGYFPMGRRVFKISDRPAAPRAIDMLLKKGEGRTLCNRVAAAQIPPSGPGAGHPRPGQEEVGCDHYRRPGHQRQPGPA